MKYSLILAVAAIIASSDAQRPVPIRPIRQAGKVLAAPVTTKPAATTAPPPAATTPVVVATPSSSAVVVSQSSAPAQVSASPAPGASCDRYIPLRNKLTTLFKASDGQCTDLARAAIRLAFHDAGAFTTGSAIGGGNIARGGADGSLLVDVAEQKRPENNGLQGIISVLQPMAKQFGVSNADLVQYAGMHATISCPGGPAVKFMSGRADTGEIAPDGFLPPVDGSSDFLIRLFLDKGMSPTTLAALMGAHSTSKQRFVDPSRANQSQDSTPGTWDVAYYGETLQSLSGSSPPNTFTFKSDINMAQDPRMADEWRSFVDGQGRWSGKYADAHFQMSMFGVKNQGAMIDCSNTLPQTAQIGALGEQANRNSRNGVR